MSPWVDVARTASGSATALVMVYAFVRAFTFTGANRYMRWCLSTLAAVLTYSQFTLIAAPMPLTSRTFVGWVGSGVMFGLWLVAIRADTRASHVREKKETTRAK